MAMLIVDATEFMLAMINDDPFGLFRCVFIILHAYVLDVKGVDNRRDDYLTLLPLV